MTDVQLQQFRQSIIQKIEDSFYALKQKYSISESNPMSSENEPYFIQNSPKKCVYLLHGFIGSPYEMNNIARMAKDKGFSLLNDLIPGHGHTAQTSNPYLHSDWTIAVAEKISLLRQIFDEIHLVGFSTGALLLHQYQRMNPDWKASSVSYYSPYFLPYFKSTGFLKNTLSLFSDQVPIRTAYQITRYQDIRVAYLDSEHYMKHIPLITAEQISLLGRSEFELSNHIVTTSPTCVFLTECDQVLEYSASYELIQRCYKNHRVVSFEKIQKVPHHLMVGSVSKVADEISQQTLEWILST